MTGYSQTLPTVSGQANPDSGSWAYTYNQREELATAKLGSNPTLTYTYTDSGDRQSVQVGAGTPTTTTYDGADRVQAVGSTSYTWDAADQLTNVGSSRTYAYDAWGRTTSATVGATTVGYAYDALDRTTSRTPSSGSATSYAYTGLGQSIASATTGAAQPVLLAYRQEGPMAQKQASTIRAYEQDPHGDLSVITDTTGTATGTISYDPWGSVDAAIGTDAQQSLLGYQSQPTDPTTGLTDMGTRLYDPAMGRFTERDVIFGTPANPLTLNQYAYGADSPLVYTDPTGMLIQCSGCTDAEKQAAKDQTAAGITATEGDDSAHNYYASQVSNDVQQILHMDAVAGIDFPRPRPVRLPPHVSVSKLAAGLDLCAECGELPREGFDATPDIGQLIAHPYDEPSFLDGLIIDHPVDLPREDEGFTPGEDVGTLVGSSAGDLCKSAICIGLIGIGIGGPPINVPGADDAGKLGEAGGEIYRERDRLRRVGAPPDAGEKDPGEQSPPGSS